MGRRDKTERKPVGGRTHSALGADQESGLSLRAGRRYGVNNFFLLINVTQALVDFRKAEKR